MNLVAILVNVGAALVWLWSRTLGLPFGPDAGMPQAVGPLDVTATIEEVILAGLLLRRAYRPEQGDGGALAWLQAALWSALIVFVTSNVLLESRTHLH